MRNTLPIIIAFLSGLIMVVGFFLNPATTFLGNTEEEVLQWASIVGGFTLLLGVVSIVRVNAKTVSQKKKGWLFNLATLISIFAMAIPSVVPFTTTSNFGKVLYKIFPESWASLFGTAPGSIYDWLFNYMDSPMMATMFAMLAFYIASAAYRAFRARNAEATLLLLTAVLVMLWRIPMGEAFLKLFSDNIPVYINTYIMNGANAAVQRGIVIGAALGAASMSLRIMLGIERTYMGK
ncbi:conserved membrane hypothetical protein [Candidatus Zixiibacteriota bacterium]|nr:conserved membrane hypothetical protein [candidate division Zixibacteria bacterium]